MKPRRRNYPTKTLKEIPVGENGGSDMPYIDPVDIPVFLVCYGAVLLIVLVLLNLLKEYYLLIRSKTSLRHKLGFTILVLIMLIWGYLATWGAHHFYVTYTAY